METKDEILSRVVDLYLKYGIKSVTMEDVARELGISKKTLYQLVENKSELVEMAMEYEYDRTHLCFQEVISAGQNAIDELMQVSRLVTVHMRYNSAVLEYDLKKYYPEFFRRRIQKKREMMYNSVLENMKKGKEEGIYREELNEDVIARLHVQRMESMRDNPSFAPPGLSTGKVFKEVFIYHIRGIANEKGIEFLKRNIHKLDHLDLENQETN